MNKLRNSSKKFGMLLALGVAAASQAVAEVPSEITELTADATTTFNAAKVVVIAVVGFVTLLGIVKLVRKR